MHFHLYIFVFLCFSFKQKTAYEMRISDWSSDVCSSDLGVLQSSVRKSERLKVGRRHLAAPVDLQLEAEALTLVQALQPGPLDSRDMDECIGLAVIALN